MSGATLATVGSGTKESVIASVVWHDTGAGPVSVTFTVPAANDFAGIATVTFLQASILMFAGDGNARQSLISFGVNSFVPMVTFDGTATPSLPVKRRRK